MPARSARRRPARAGRGLLRGPQGQQAQRRACGACACLALRGSFPDRLRRLRRAARGPAACLLGKSWWTSPARYAFRPLGGSRTVPHRPRACCAGQGPSSAQLGACGFAVRPLRACCASRPAAARAAARRRRACGAVVLPGASRCMGSNGVDFPRCFAPPFRQRLALCLPAGAGAAVSSCLTVSRLNRWFALCRSLALAAALCRWSWWSRWAAFRW